MNLATFTEIAAFVGAAAWLPQIASWIYQRYVSAQISILPDKQVQIGYTCLGPIFNIRIAFSADKKDAIVNRFDVCLLHEDGDEHRLDWVAMTEHFSEIVDQAGNRQSVEREQAPIAFKITTTTLLEKFVRFQEPKFMDSIRPPLEAWGSHVSFLDSKGGNCSNEILSSKQHSDLLATIKQHFWWKKGRYTFSFKMGSPHKLHVEKHAFHFELSQLDIDALKKNLLGIDADFINRIKAREPDYQWKDVNWQWRHVTVSRS